MHWVAQKCPHESFAPSVGGGTQGAPYALDRNYMTEDVDGILCAETYLGLGVGAPGGHSDQTVMVMNMVWGSLVGNTWWIIIWLWYGF